MPIQPVQVQVNINKGTTQGVDEAKSKLESFGDSLKHVAEIALGFSLANVGEQIAQAGRDAVAFAVNSASNIQQTRLVLDAFTGSAEKGQKAMEILNQVSRAAPLIPLSEIFQGGEQVLGMGFSLDQLGSKLTEAGELATASHAPLSAAVDLLTRAKEGVFNLREYGQFGISASELEKYGVAFKTTAAGMTVMNRAALMPALDKLIQTKFGGVFQAQAQTFAGAVQNTKDDLMRLSGAILGVDENGNVAKGSLFEQMTKDAQELYKFLDSHKDQIANFLKGVTSGLAGALEKLPGIVKSVSGDIKTMTTDFQNLKKWVDDNKGALEIIAGLISIFVAPALTILGINAAIAGGKMAVEFAGGIAKAVGGLISYLFYSPMLLLAKLTDIAETTILVGLYARDAVVKGVSALATYGLAAATWVLNAALAVLTSPIFLVIAAIGLLVLAGYELMTHWEQVKLIGTQVWNSLTDMIKMNINTIIGFINVLLGGLSKISGGKINFHLDTLQYSGNNLSNIGSDFSNFKLNPLEQGVGNLLGSLGNIGGGPAPASNANIANNQGLGGVVINSYPVFQNANSGAMQQYVQGLNYQLSTIR